MNPDKRILIADDHPIFRQGLRGVIETNSDLQVAGEASDGETALALIEQLHPDVAVLDIDMPKADGFELVRSMKNRRLNVPVIFLTLHVEADFISRALDSGVAGYVLKDSAVADIVAAIRAALAGQHYLSPAAAGLAVQRRAISQQPKPSSLGELTPAERSILRLLAEYKTSSQIGQELFISPRTVDNHRANICQKLGLNGRHDQRFFADAVRPATLSVPAEFPPGRFRRDSG